jgi:uncharacterized membrane protein YfcA
VTPIEGAGVLAAGVAAGAINTIVGSGSLITFPALLAVGYPPVAASISNTIGIAPGSASGVVGYRRELAGQRGRLLRLGAASLVGGLTGAVLLLFLPEEAFNTIVPVLIGIACVLVVVQPKLTRWLRRSHDDQTHSSRWLMVGVYGVGVYGGYFGAAQGVLLIALLGLFLSDDLQRLNAAKNVLAGISNMVAAMYFLAITDVAWLPVLLIAVGSVIGAQVGAAVGRRLSPLVLRVVVVMVGIVAIVHLLV